MFRALVFFFTLSVLVTCTLAVAFQNPPQLHSENGQLNVTLIAEMWNSTLQNVSGEFETWNGTLVPPTLRLRLGDVVRVTIFNELANVTNLHYHGTEVSPLPGADDVLVTIATENLVDVAYRSIYTDSCCSS